MRTAQLAASKAASVTLSSELYKGGHMSIGKTRGLLYWLARILGDVNAVKKGKVGKRVARREPVRLPVEDWAKSLSERR